LLHAGYLHDKQRDAEAVAYLSQIEMIYEEEGLWTARLRHHILKALCYLALNDHEDAVREFSKAYEMTNQYKTITPFIEHGSEMARLIETARADTSRRFRSVWRQRRW
jgi:tetratricopeptide (TPR) repeat protein